MDTNQIEIQCRMKKSEIIISKSDSLDQAFEKIKKAFNQNLITADEFLSCLEIHNRTKELTSKLSKTKHTMQKSISDAELKKAWDQLESALSFCKSETKPIGNEIKKSNSDIPLPELLKKAKYSSDQNLRIAATSSEYANVRLAAQMELKIRGKA